MRDPVRVWELNWVDVDPEAHAFSSADADALREALLARAPDRKEQVFDDVIVGCVGAWGSGWRWAKDEGSIGGGVVTGWCCASHSMKGSDAAIVGRVLAGLHDWRAWLVHLSSLFSSLPPRQDGLERRLQRALVVVVNEVARATSCGDAWYNHAQQVLGWYLQRWGAPVDAATQAVRSACRGVFRSWSAPDEGTYERVAGELAGAVVDRVSAEPPEDALRIWRTLRARLDAWSFDPPLEHHEQKKQKADLDGHRLYIETLDRDRDRAAEMHAALTATREQAQQKQELTLALLQSLAPVSTLRSGPAYAKAGAEYYSFSAGSDGADGTLAACDRALRESNEEEAPALFCACRAYLDVCFFHPFVDGNARAARLAFDLVLSRRGYVLATVDALFRHAVLAEAEAVAAFFSLAHNMAAISSRRPEDPWLSKTK